MVEDVADIMSSRTVNSRVTSDAKSARSAAKISSRSAAKLSPTEIVRKHRVRPEHFLIKDSLGYLLWLGGRNWNRQLERALRSVKLSHIEAGLLLATYFSHSEDRVPTQAYLASFTKYDPMMVSKALRALEKRGYVKRQPKAASNLVTLTDDGGAILAQVSELKTKAMEDFFGGLGRERKTLARLLKSLLNE